VLSVAGMWVQLLEEEVNILTLAGVSAELLPLQLALKLVDAGER